MEQQKTQWNRTIPPYKYIHSCKEGLVSDSVPYFINIFTSPFLHSNIISVKLLCDREEK